MGRLTTTIVACAAIIGAAAPASAGYVKATFSGSILAANPGAPADLAVGTPITFEAVYDTAKLVDRTDSINAFTGLNFTSVLAASLADDPLASMTITVGSETFTKTDQVNYGTPEGDCGTGCNLGAGDFPIATYLNGSFAGIGNLFVNAEGYSIDADPIAYALFGGFDLGSGAGGYQFFIGHEDNGDPFAETYVVGDYNAAAVTITPVPETASWAMMIMGIGLAGSVLRFGQSRARNGSMKATALS